MTLIFRVLALMVMLAVMTPAPGPATAGPSPSLFPLVVGATWARVSDDGVTSTSRVVGPKTVGTRQCVVIERKATERGRERVFRTCFLVTATEVLVLETTTPRGDQTVLNPPRPALKLPPRTGQMWS